MAWLKTIGIFLKGFFQTLNNPQRLEIKKQKEDRKDVEHVEDAPVREKERELEVVELDGDIAKKKHQNEKREEKREGKKKFGPFWKRKKKKAEK